MINVFFEKLFCVLPFYFCPSFEDTLSVGAFSHMLVSTRVATRFAVSACG